MRRIEVSQAPEGEEVRLMSGMDPPWVKERGLMSVMGSLRLEESGSEG